MGKICSSGTYIPTMECEGSEGGSLQCTWQAVKISTGGTNECNSFEHFPWISDRASEGIVTFCLCCAMWKKIRRSQGRGVAFSLYRDGRVNTGHLLSLYGNIVIFSASSVFLKIENNRRTLVL